MAFTTACNDVGMLQMNPSGAPQPSLQPPTPPRVFSFLLTDEVFLLVPCVLYCLSPCTGNLGCRAIETVCCSREPSWGPCQGLHD